jgi:hypothetical protein
MPVPRRWHRASDQALNQGSQLEKIQQSIHENFSKFFALPPQKTKTAKIRPTTLHVKIAENTA